jgi:hypothetical protein
MPTSWPKSTAEESLCRTDSVLHKLSSEVVFLSGFMTLSLSEMYWRLVLAELALEERR